MAAAGLAAVVSAAGCGDGTPPSGQHSVMEEWGIGTYWTHYYVIREYVPGPDDYLPLQLRGAGRGLPAGSCIVKVVFVTADGAKYLALRDKMLRAGGSGASNELIEKQRGWLLLEAGGRGIDYFVAPTGEYRPGDILERKQEPARSARPF